VLAGILEAFEVLVNESLRVPAAELRRRIRELEYSIDAAGLSIPAISEQRDYFEDVLQWSVDTFGSLASGSPGPLRSDAVGVVTAR
jgi:hypothetical protein